AERLVVDTILDREDLGSTALGNGIAFPHCQWGSLERFVGVAGLLDRGIPFDARDGEPVDSIFLTLAPPDDPEQHVDVLGRLVASGRDKALRLLLRGCRTPEHVAVFLRRLDPPEIGPRDELARISLSWIERGHRDPWRELARLGLLRDDRPARHGEREG